MAITAKVLILYQDWVREAALTASSAALAVDRLQDHRPSVRWRATGKSAEWVRAAWSSPVDMTHIAVWGHNLDVGGTMRPRAGDDGTFATATYDPGALDAWEPVAGWGEDGWGLSLGGYPILSAFNDYRPLRIFSIGQRISAAYARVDLANPANAASHVEAGGFGCWLGIQPERNFALDWDNDMVDPSEQIETEASLQIVERRSYRVLTLSLPWLSRAEAEGAFNDLKRIVGVKRPVIVVPFPLGDAPRRYRTSIYGVPKANPGFRNPHYDVYATSLSVRELVE